MPQVLYKYLPPERKTYLSNGLLRFTPPSALNDPYEALPGISEELLKVVFSLVKKEFDEIPEGLKSLESDPSLLIEYFYKQGMQKIDSTLGILSLSKRWDNPLMWSHYTESHQGLCIGFNLKHSFFDTNENYKTNQNMTVLPVKYSDKRFLLAPERMNRQEALDVLHIKSLDWEYEEEVRVVATLKEATKIIPASPYDISLFKIPHEAISEIIVGLRVDNEVVEQAQELANELSIPLYKTIISKQSFILDRVLINNKDKIIP